MFLRDQIPLLVSSLERIIVVQYISRSYRIQKAIAYPCLCQK